MSLLAGACADSSSDSRGAPKPGPVSVVTLPPLEVVGEAAPDAPVEVRVAASAAQVRLELAGVSQPAEELTAELESDASGEVRRWTVDAAAGGVAVTVPIYAVPAGQHVLTLWQGDADVVRRYALRVIVE